MSSTIHKYLFLVALAVSSLFSCSDSSGSISSVEENSKQEGSGQEITEEGEEKKFDRQDAGDQSLAGQDLGINLVDFGAVGDGIQDNTSIIQQALDSHPRIYLPATEKGYVVNGTLTIKNPVIFTGDNTVIKTNSKTLFKIDADKVSIRELVIRHDRASKGTTFLLNTGKSGIEKIYLEKMEVYDAEHGITDSNHNANLIINLHVSDINFWHGQNSQVLLRDAFAYIFFEKVTFDFTRIADFAVNFPVVSLTSNEGSFFTDVHINTNGNIPATGTGVGFSFTDSKAVWITRSMADTVGGYGFIFNNTSYIYLTDVVASLNANGGFYFQDCSNIQASNWVAAGRKDTGLTAPGSAHGIVINNSTDFQITNLSARNNTGFPVVIDTNSQLIKGVNLTYSNNGTDSVGGGGNFEY